MLLHFNAKVGKEDIFKLTIGYESLQEIRAVNFATSKNLTVKIAMFPQRHT
jgi:hypothetical protein